MNKEKALKNQGLEFREDIRVWGELPAIKVIYFLSVLHQYYLIFFSITSIFFSSIDTFFFISSKSFSLF